MGISSPWCHAFASWCAGQSGMETGEFPKTASTTAGMDWFKSRGMFKHKGGYTPKRGDFIYFKTGASHVGLVESASGGKVTTIEGNSGARSCVGRYTYSLSYKTITGYGLPNYKNLSGRTYAGSENNGERGGQEYDPSYELLALNSFLKRLEAGEDKQPELVGRALVADSKPPRLKVRVIVNGDKPSATEIPVLDDLQVVYERIGTPGKLTFKTIIEPENPVNKEETKTSINEGDRVSVRVDDKILFVGYVFTRQQDKDETLTVTAYNQIRYLKNKDTRVYFDMTASELLKAIADDYGLVIGELCDTKLKMSRIEDNTALIDIILNALDETFMATGEIYTLFDNEGKLTLKNVKDMRIENCLVCKETAQNYSYKTSIDSDVYNQVKLVYDNVDTGAYDAYVTKDSDNIRKWGLLQYFEKIKHPALGPIKSQVILKSHNRIKRNLTAEGVIGDTDIIAGCTVPVILELGDININNFMVVEKVTHIIKNGEYFMDLIVTGGEFVV